MAGIDDVTPHIELEGADETSEQFRQVAAAAQEMADRIMAAMNQVGSAGDAIKSVTEEGKKAFQDMGTVAADSFARILDSVSSGNFTGIVTKMFGEFAGAVTESIQKLAEFIDKQAVEMETLANLASATGMATSEILGLREAFASVGISTSGFERSIGRLAITISNEWSQIQQAVRTSSDQQVGAMLHVQQAALNLEKAHHSMNEALSQSVSQAAHNALGIESAALGLRKAGEALHDFILQSRSNSLGIESAENALKRAQLNLQKDQGFDVSAQEKSLKLSDDKVRIKEAEQRLEEARNKKAKESLEMEELQNRAKKAALDAQEAQNKAIEDSIKMSDRLVESRLHEQQAALAVREAQEKQHDVDLKDIPAIAKEIDSVVDGQKKWSEVINVTEISAQNLTKAVILAAAAGSKEQPTTKAVFKEMSQLFEKMGDDATSGAAKLTLVQHMMGAGFRAGQASAAQIVAVLNRGWNELEKFTADMEKFGKAVRLDAASEQLKKFNSEFAQMQGAIDIVSKAWAGLASQMLTPLFETVRTSLEKTDGTLNKLAQGVLKFTDGISKAVNGLGELTTKIAGPVWSAFVQVVSTLAGMWGEMADGIGKVASRLAALTGSGLEADAFWVTFTSVIGGAALASRGLAVALGQIMLRLAIIPGAVALAITALGDLFKIVAYGWSKMPARLGGGGENNQALMKFGQEIEALGQSVSRNIAKMVGASEEGLDAATKKENSNSSAAGLAKGVFGDSKELAGTLKESGKDQLRAGEDQKSAGQTQKEVAQAAKDAQTAEANRKLNEKDSTGKSQNDRNQEFFDREIKRLYSPENKTEDVFPGLSKGDKGDKGASEIKEAVKEGVGEIKQGASEIKEGGNEIKQGATESRAVTGEEKALVESEKATNQKHREVVDKFGTVGDLWHSIGLIFQVAVGKIPPGATGKAGGGYISGPGTSTSDSIPAWLSDGEYVVRSAAVAKYGQSFFDAVNKGVAKFSEGGFVDSGMERDKVGQYRGSVKIGRSSIGDALLDTGASNLSINQKMARDGGIDLSRGEKVNTSTAGGEVEAIMALIPVAIKGINRTLKGVVYPDDMLKDALIGMNFLNSLQDFAMTKSALLLQAASGGHVRGPGTGTSDSIPARLSDGEYVVRAAAVSQYGIPLFDALNNLALGGGARFAMGGPVGARNVSLPSAMGGGAHSTLNLTIDGNHFDGLKAPDAVASKLKTYAVSRQSSAAQKMPSWMR